VTGFFKLSGAGNDFIALVEPERSPTVAQVKAWCTRGLSVGADGLFVLRRTNRGAEMSHYNADGTAAELCLNGTRCAARLALELAWAQEEIDIVTGAGPVQARRITETEIALTLPPPTDAPRPTQIALERMTYSGWRLSIGVPHFILEWPGSLGTAPVESLGSTLRSHSEFAPEGTNVDFVSHSDDSHHLFIRSFERGVEAETLACGTGVLAATATGLSVGRLNLPVTAHTRGGFLLTVTGEAVAGVIRTWSLAGDARIVARGELRPEASSYPSG